MLPAVAEHGFSSAAIAARAQALLRRVGLEAVADNLAPHMSGGQQQRVAVARALALAPELVLADEPTGNLDSHSADEVFALLRDINREQGTSFLLVTHNLDLARRCDRIVRVVDGRIADGDGPR
jgi:lipoprotein-releasing system ATP-binding protein